jgi:CopG family nickel-responsive transcriptional regulator
MNSAMESLPGIWRVKFDIPYWPGYEQPYGHACREDCNWRHADHTIANRRTDPAHLLTAPSITLAFHAITIKVEKAMPQLSRTGVSLDEDLLREFDRLIARRGYKNRSEAFRDLIREALLTEVVESNKPVVGTLTLVYDHHVPNLSQKLTEVQHTAGAMILAATHVHLDHHYCLEVIIMKGRSRDLQAVADGMLALRGVELGKLVLANSGKDLKIASHSH